VRASSLGYPYRKARAPSSPSRRRGTSGGDSELLSNRQCVCLGCYTTFYMPMPVCYPSRKILLMHTFESDHKGRLKNHWHIAFEPEAHICIPQANVHQYSSVSLPSDYISSAMPSLSSLFDSMSAAFFASLTRFLHTIWSFVVRVTLFLAHAVEPSPSPPELPIASPCLYNPGSTSVTSAHQPEFPGEHASHPFRP
jgi:hypothetical protein